MTGVPRMVKVSVNLREDIVTMLKEIAQKRGTTVSNVLRDAIGLERFVDETLDKDEKILVADSHGRMRELLINR